MSTTVFEIKKGDRLPPLKAIAMSQGVVVNLTAFTSITFCMRHSSEAPTIAGAATGDASGNLQYNWALTDTAIAGTYKGEFKGTDATGKTQIFPTAGSISIKVYDVAC